MIGEQQPYSMLKGIAEVLFLQMQVPRRHVPFACEAHVRFIRISARGSTRHGCIRIDMAGRLCSTGATGVRYTRRVGIGTRAASGTGVAINNNHVVVQP
jgi:hypothetical protein